MAFIDLPLAQVQVCPPSTVYAAYNHYAAQKEITVNQFKGHDSGGAFGVRALVAWLHDRFG